MPKIIPTVILLLTFSATVACSGDPADAEPPELEGLYVLNLVNNSPPPTVVHTEDAEGSEYCTEHADATDVTILANSSTATFSTSGSVQIVLSGTDQCLSGSEVIASESWSATLSMTWTREGNTVTLHWPPEMGEIPPEMPQITGTVGDGTFTTAFPFGVIDNYHYTMATMEYGKAGS